MNLIFPSKDDRNIDGILFLKNKLKATIQSLDIKSTIILTFAYLVQKEKF